jgi:hypothetical protein
MLSPTLTRRWFESARMSLRAGALSGARDHCVHPCLATAGAAGCLTRAVGALRCRRAPNTAAAARLRQPQLLFDVIRERPSCRHARWEAQRSKVARGTVPFQSIISSRLWLGVVAARAGVGDACRDACSPSTSTSVRNVSMRRVRLAPSVVASAWVGQLAPQYARSCAAATAGSVSRALMSVGSTVAGSSLVQRCKSRES